MFILVLKTKSPERAGQDLRALGSMPRTGGEEQQAGRSPARATARQHHSATCAAASDVGDQSLQPGMDLCMPSALGALVHTASSAEARPF